MPIRTIWEEKARQSLRAEMKARKVTYSQLADRLAMMGLQEDERNLRNKVSRGKFTAAFMLQCLSAIRSDDAGP